MKRSRSQSLLAAIPFEIATKAFSGVVLAVALSSLLAARGALAHEPVILPMKIGDEGRFIAGASQQRHLSFDEGAIDFGEVVIGSAATQTVAVTNETTRDVTVAVTGPPGVTVVPNAFSLAAGTTTAPELTVTWAPTQAGAPLGGLVFTVGHDGVANDLDEALSLTGQAGREAKLRLDVPTFGETDVSGTDFGMVSLGDSGAKSPTFEMTITNNGGLTARNVRVQVPGPGAIFADQGVCHEGLNEASICVANKTGTTPAGGTQFEPTNDFGDLAPGATKTAIWRIVPTGSGFVDQRFGVAFVTGSESRDQPFDIAGQIIPFAIPGEGFLKAGEGNGAMDGFGSPADPLDGDPLGSLRPTGFDARTVFNIGDVDSVDLRTGGLTLVVPIGGAQPVRGSLAYELKAVFNSHLWHRRSFAEIRTNTTDPEPPPDPEPDVVPRNAEYPNPVFNLGTGWSFHLGRLLPPYEPAGIEIGPVCPNDLQGFEKHVDTGSRFVYVDANGTQHELWLQIHGEEQLEDGEEPDEQPFLYTRDGSYLRLVLDPGDPNRRWVEEPSGIKRLFVRRSTREPTLPDEWLLESIEDGYGNRVSIEYGPTTWTIRDHQDDGGAAWRTTVVTFESWTGRTSRDPMVVSRVDLPGFDGDPVPRTYTFTTSDQTLDYPPRSDFHPVYEDHCPGVSRRVRMPRLDSISLPDGSVYSFAYGDDPADIVRLEAATLPTGATVAYQYARVWDSPPDCKNTQPAYSIHGIARRTVTDVGGAVLDDRRYLRETLRTPDVPDGICSAFLPAELSAAQPPWSEQTVAVWSLQETGLSTASVHHFNIYPFDDSCSRGTTAVDESLCDEGADGFWRLASGRTHIERNLKISHSAPADPLDPTRRLSEELYSCTTSIDGIAIPHRTLTLGDAVGDDVSALIGNAACTKRESTYARYEVAKAGHDCRQASAHCLRDSRLQATRTVFHDDVDNQERERWVGAVNSDFDGLGHYRRTDTSSNFASVTVGTLEQSTFRNWNAGVGTLTLDPDHRVNTNITLPSTWLLGTWDFEWTIEPGGSHGGEACFDPALGHITHERMWQTTAVNTTNIAANRSAQDVVVVNEVDSATGEVERQRFFGADTYALPTNNAWCTSNVWVEGNQDYAVVHGYELGVRNERRVEGDSVYDLRRTIDQGTGWTATEIRNSSEVVTFDYDAMGRTTWATSDLTASQHVDYRQQADGRWQLTATIYPRGTTASTANPSPIRVYDASFDGLGRLVSETFPRYDDDPGGTRRTAVRSISYEASGNIRSVSSLDRPARSTSFDYDFRGRLRTTTQPDGSKSDRQYAGVRKTTIVSCVGTGGTTTSGICNGSGFEKAETVLERDWKGRVIEVTAPLDTAGDEFTTVFTYDTLDNRTSARRRDFDAPGQVTQWRNWFFDGRGFLTRENIPERAAIDFGTFNTRGQASTQAEPGRNTTFTYDRVGRLRRIAVGNRALKRFLYCDPEAESSDPGLCDTSGPANGQLVRAIRNNYRGVAESGLGTSATWLTTSTFGYDAPGRQSSRDTAVIVRPGWSTDPAPPAGTITTFSQSWAYDDLGNVVALGYPTCNTTSDDCDSGRTVDYVYEQGFFLTGVTEGALGASLTYHASGLVNGVAHQGGGGTDIYGVASGMPRIASIDLGVGSVNRFNLGTVGYDWAGNITGIGGDAFTYDKNGRLAAAATTGVSHSFAYDNFDNHRGPGAGTVDPATNQLTDSVGDVIYDPYGNLIQGRSTEGIIAAVYDELDKLAGLHEPSGVSLLGVYDHDDLRILTWRANDPVNPDFTWTLRNGLRVVREYVGLGSAIKLSKDYVHAGARLIASEKYLAPNAGQRHYHEDQVGNARLITGTAARRVHYAPFGAELFGITSGERAVGFQGHENDGLTTYMRGRTYLPSVGFRFLQVDPARDGSAWSQYAFVANNPIVNADPTGLCPRGQFCDEITVRAFSPSIQGSQRRMLALARKEGTKLGTDFSSPTAQILKEAGASAPVMAVAEKALTLSLLPGLSAAGIVGFSGHAAITLSAEKVVEGAAGGAVVALADGKLTEDEIPALVVGAVTGGINPGKGSGLVGAAGAAVTKAFGTEATKSSDDNVKQEDFFRLHEEVQQLREEVERLKEE